MKPTLNENDLVLIKKNIRINKLTRNSIIIFTSPYQNNINFIKRLIGLPGDLIQITNTGILIVNSNREIIITKEESKDEWIQYEWKLLNNEFIVLGDNFHESNDSRKFGPINFNQIIGKAIFSLKPIKFLK